MFWICGGARRGTGVWIGGDDGVMGGCVGVEVGRMRDPLWMNNVIGSMSGRHGELLL